MPASPRKMENLLRALFPEQMGKRDKGLCPFCGGRPNPGKMTEVEVAELAISGLCKDCQDSAFAESEEGG